MNPADPNLKSFLRVEPESHFPIQNLPYGVFRAGDRHEPRVGVAIGDFILDLAILEQRGLLDSFAVGPSGESLFARSSLNGLMALGPASWGRLREMLVGLLRHDEPRLRDDDDLARETLVRQRDAEMLLPVEIGDYTDFYSSREHATNVGSMLRGPADALNANWLHLPVAYHGRSSSVVVSGTDLHRPCGQTKPDDAASPKFGPSRAVDFELEMGLFIGPGNALGEPIPADRVPDHVFGMVLVNDWSARDVQKWEYVPLGPFLAKNFGTSISPWVVTLDALEPFRCPGPSQDPPPLDYLRTTGDRAYDIRLEVAIQPAGKAESTVVCRSNYRHLYWNCCQQVAHHTVGGCNLRTGDLLASGTISGPAPDARGCLLELTLGGRNPLLLPDGLTRRFLDDGDRVTMTGWCQGDGYRVGFGDVTGTLLPARMDGAS
jgi:fumarylacetoacetase